MRVDSQTKISYNLSLDEVQKAIIDFIKKTHDIVDVDNADFGWGYDHSCYVVITETSTKETDA